MIDRVNTVVVTYMGIAAKGVSDQTSEFGLSRRNVLLFRRYGFDHAFEHCKRQVDLRRFFEALSLFLRRRQTSSVVF